MMISNGNFQDHFNNEIYNLLKINRCLKQFSISDSDLIGFIIYYNALY